jgi:hypothetical protein
MQVVTRENNSTVWILSRKLHDATLDAANERNIPHFFVCGSPQGALENLLRQLAPDIVTHLDELEAKKKIPIVCNHVAPIFGFNDGIGLRRILDDAGFILTPQIAQQLLQLHARRRIREPLIFEGVN